MVLSIVHWPTVEQIAVFGFATVVKPGGKNPADEDL
jgi:hypothetical protein